MASEYDPSEFVDSDFLSARKTTATIGQTQAKPAPGILPTQDMPKVQGLE